MSKYTHSNCATPRTLSRKSSTKTTQSSSSVLSVKSSTNSRKSRKSSQKSTRSRSSRNSVSRNQEINSSSKEMSFSEIRSKFSNVESNPKSPRIGSIGGRSTISSNISSKSRNSYTKPLIKQDSKTSAEIASLPTSYEASDTDFSRTDFSKTGK